MIQPSKQQWSGAYQYDIFYFVSLTKEQQVDLYYYECSTIFSEIFICQDILVIVEHAKVMMFDNISLR